jgi:hypothetical protein
MAKSLVERTSMKRFQNIYTIHMLIQMKVENMMEMQDLRKNLLREAMVSLKR